MALTAAYSGPVGSPIKTAHLFFNGPALTGSKRSLPTSSITPLPASIIAGDQHDGLDVSRLGHIAGTAFVKHHRRAGTRLRHSRKAVFQFEISAGMEQIGVVVRTREIYRSANGDRWLLALDSDTDRVFVRHEPNLPSGGQVADIEIGAFLVAAGSGPEKQELLRLIGTLVRGPR